MNNTLKPTSEYKTQTNPLQNFDRQDYGNRSTLPLSPSIRHRRSARRRDACFAPASLIQKPFNPLSARN